MQSDARAMTNDFSASSYTTSEQKLRLHSQMKADLKKKYMADVESMNSEFKKDVAIFIKQLK